MDAEKTVSDRVEELRGSKIGLPQQVWGPPSWTFLHAVTFNYPDKPDPNTQELYRRFFLTAGDVLPCGKCRKHYREHSAAVPIRLQSRRDLVEWLIDIHNRANTATGKREWTYREVIAKYTCEFDKCLKIPGYEDIMCRAPYTTYAVVLLVAGVTAFALSRSSR